MTTRFCLLVAALSVAALPSAAGAQDAKGSKDHPLLTRLPDYRIISYDERESAVGEFREGDHNLKVDGHRYDLNYQVKKGTKPPTQAQVVRNFVSALESVGGKVTYRNNFLADVALTNDGAQTRVRICSVNGGAAYRLTIVENAAIRQDLVANADALAAGAAGGVFFDSGKSVVKPESEAAPAEVAGLLAKQASLKLRVAGHTDNPEDFAANQKLSQACAKAEPLEDGGEGFLSRADLKDWRCHREDSGRGIFWCHHPITLAVGATVEVVAPPLGRPKIERSELVDFEATASGFKVTGLLEGSTSLMATTPEAIYSSTVTVTGPKPPHYLVEKGWKCGPFPPGFSRGRSKFPWLCQRDAEAFVNVQTTLVVPRHTGGGVDDPEMLQVLLRSGYLLFEGVKPGKTKMYVWTDDAMLIVNVEVKPAR